MSKEPVAISGGILLVVQAVLAVLAAFDIPITPVQSAAINGLVVGVLTLWTRQQVSPVAK